MFRVKICGVTSAEEAGSVSRLGADAIGLNFYPASPRYIGGTASSAEEPPWGGDLLRVGVFVNASTKEIRDATKLWSLGAIQLHGDESPELLAEFSDIPCIKVFRVTRDSLGAIQKFLDDCEARGRRPDAILVDAPAERDYGGSGHRSDWQLLAEHRSLFHPMPLILAGGLDSSNVAEAIVTVRPTGVDVASGVESSPGVKDAGKVTDFIRRSLLAFGDSST